MLGIVLLIVQAGLAIPMIIQLLRARDRSGISLTGEMIWIVAGAGWIAYGVATGAVAITISGALAMVTSSAITILIWRSAPGRHRTALTLSIVTAVFLSAGLVIAGLPGLSMTLAAFGLVQFVPQFVTSLSAVRSGASAEGVSVLGAAARAGYTLGWAFYAGAWFVWGQQMTRIDWPLVSWGIAGGVTFGLQAVAAARSHRLTRRA